MRFHSANIVRIHWARSGTSMPASRSTAIDEPELVVERADPVVAVHQHQHLARVAELGELLGRPVHVADHRLGAHDHLAVELEHHAQDAVGRGVLRADVEDHLLGRESTVGTTSTSRPPPRIMLGDLGALEGGALAGVGHRRTSCHGSRVPRPSGRRSRVADARDRLRDHDRTRAARFPRSTRCCAPSPAQRAAATVGRPLLKRQLAGVLAELRAQADAAERKSADRPSTTSSWPGRSARASRIATGLTPVINATGVILHTNLGRAPLPERAARAAARAARGYTDLEVDRDSRARGAGARARAEAMLHRPHGRRGRARREQLRRGACCSPSPPSPRASRCSSRAAS